MRHNISILAILIILTGFLSGCGRITQDTFEKMHRNVIAKAEAEGDTTILNIMHNTLIQGLNAMDGEAIMIAQGKGFHDNQEFTNAVITYSKALNHAEFSKDTLSQIEILNCIGDVHYPKVG